MKCLTTFPSCMHVSFLYGLLSTYKLLSYFIWKCLGQVSEKDLRNLAKYPIYTLGENGGVLVASLDETVLNGRNSRDCLSRNEQPDCSKYSEEHISVVPNTTYTLMMNDLSSITENSYISSERL